VPPVNGAQAGLDGQQWTSVPFAPACLAFLQAEWDKIPAAAATNRSLIDHPDLNSGVQNQHRLELLRTRRQPLLEQIPTNTSWFEVRYLTAEHVHQLLVIGRCGWDSPSDSNELARVAQRCSKLLATDPSKWAHPLLWGHSREGPFTILEGNNRLVALAGTVPRLDFTLPVYVGLSTMPCLWHLPDPFPVAGA